MLAVLPEEDPPVPKPKPLAEAAEVPVEREPEPEAEVPLDPESLVGLTFSETEKLLGEPALLVEEPPAKIWVYNGSDCILNIFFYPKVGGTDFRVLTYKAKGGSNPQEEGSFDFAERCLTQLVADAQAGRDADLSRGSAVDGTIKAGN